MGKEIDDLENLILEIEENECGSQEELKNERKNFNIR